MLDFLTISFYSAVYITRLNTKQKELLNRLELPQPTVNKILEKVKISVKE